MRLKSLLEDIELLGEVSKISTLGKCQVRKCVVLEEVMDIIRENKEKYLVKRAALTLLGGLLDY